jgi:predicted DsbA family dithiol-disulfide isomerase
LETTKKVAEDLKIETEVEYITDVTKMIEMGVMTSPVLAIDGNPVLTGGGKSEEEIKKALCDEITAKDENESGGCSCGGNC